MSRGVLSVSRTRCLCVTQIILPPFQDNGLGEIACTRAGAVYASSPIASKHWHRSETPLCATSRHLAAYSITFRFDWLACRTTNWMDGVKSNCAVLARFWHKANLSRQSAICPLPRRRGHHRALGGWQKGVRGRTLTRPGRKLHKPRRGCLDTKVAPIARGHSGKASPRYYEAFFSVTVFLLGRCLTATFLPRSWP